jgi:plasmid stabilization system protein ParE
VSARVLKRPRATIDLLDHFAYIGERGSLEKAEQFLKAVERAVELLAGMPEMNPYLILYRPLKRGIEVLHVFHGVQDVTPRRSAHSACGIRGSSRTSPLSPSARRTPTRPTWPSG